VIYRRLDRILVSEDLHSYFGHYRSWVESPYFSYHAPICFQLDIPPKHKNCPFKFNGNWLEDKDFVDLVKKTWIDTKFSSELSAQRKLLWKL
jgi:hypothetical protein